MLISGLKGSVHPNKKKKTFSHLQYPWWYLAVQIRLDLCHLVFQYPSLRFLPSPKYNFIDGDISI